MSGKSEFKAPKSITVGGRRIKVLLDDDIDEHGLYSHDSRKIFIDPTKDEPNASLLHEACHAALAVSGLSEVLGDKLEEAVCRAVELLAPNIFFKMKK